MTSPDWNNDQDLLARLADALDEADAAPPDFADIGRAAFAWRDIDNELAVLTYDSGYEVRAAARAETASLRSLTFRSSHVTIEITLMPDVMIGQVYPHRSMRIRLRRDDRTVVEVRPDSFGVFTVKPPPREPFALACLLDTGAEVVTPLITP